MISLRRGSRLLRSSDITKPNIVKDKICEVYALVEATPISGPALMWTPQCDSRDMVEPTVLVMPTIKAPRPLQ